MRTPNAEHTRHRERIQNLKLKNQRKISLGDQKREPNKKKEW